VPPLLHRQAEAGRHGWPHRPVRAPVREAQGQVIGQSFLDPERRSALLGAKLAAVAGDVDGELSTFPGGAALVEVPGRRAWILAEDEPAKVLGRGLAWAWARDVTRLDLVVEDDAGLLARRASQFVDPPWVWWLNRRQLHGVEPEPLPAPSRPHADALDLVPVLEAAGVDVTVEHGVVAGEILGLEIARIVVDETGARIEVGVGRHDREAFAMVHGDLPPESALAEVVSTVRRHRTGAAEGHPLKRLAAERWLRKVVIAHPSLVGAAELWPVAGTVPRTSIKEPVPASAVGTDLEGGPIVVTASVGVDLDLVPTAADVRMAALPEARLVLAVPERDDVPATRALAGRLLAPAEVAPLPGNWRAIPLP
jgi:hypothetical protein